MKLLGPSVAPFLSLALLGAGPLAGCSSSDETPPPCQNVAAADKEACLTDHYFAASQPSSLAACPGIAAATQKISGRREIAFFQAPGMSDGDLVVEAQYLQRFYAPYDLAFFTRTPGAPLSFSYAMNGTDQQFLDAERKLGIDPQGELTPAQSDALNAAIAEIMFGELRNFVKEQSNPPKDRVNVVVLPAIASPDVARQLRDTGVIAGLGISPTLFKNIAEGDASKNLFELLALPADFTPTLFIGHVDIVTLAQNPEEVVAHEMGHALGLEHATQPGDLMTQYQADQKCRPVLTEAEVEQLRSAASQLVGEGAVGTKMIEGWRALADARDRVVASLRQKRRMN